MTRWVSARSFSEPGPGDGVFAEEQGEESHGGLSLDLSRSGSEDRAHELPWMLTAQSTLPGEGPGRGIAKDEFAGEQLQDIGKKYLKRPGLPTRVQVSRWRLARISATTQ